MDATSFPTTIANTAGVAVAVVVAFGVVVAVVTISALLVVARTIYVVIAVPAITDTGNGSGKRSNLFSEKAHAVNFGGRQQGMLQP